ncbi:unnamed protein product, partial [Prorocentrum cordatum]
GGRVPASEGYGMDRTSMDFGRWGMWIARQLHFLCAAQNGSEVGAAYFYSPTKLLTALSTRSDAVRASALHRGSHRPAIAGAAVPVPPTRVRVFGFGLYSVPSLLPPPSLRDVAATAGRWLPAFQVHALPVTPLSPCPPCRLPFLALASAAILPPALSGGALAEVLTFYS